MAAASIAALMESGKEKSEKRYSLLMSELIQSTLTRFRELETLLQDPEIYGDRNSAADLQREYKRLQPAARLSKRYIELEEELALAEELVDSDQDAADIIKTIPRELDQINKKVVRLLKEKDPLDEKDAIIEIRPAAGGGEASLFAAEIMTMLVGYAERLSFKVETINLQSNEGGGIKEATLAVHGSNPYSVFKHEAGTHRVQRVPETEAQGRIHTSTVTVAVLPESEDIEIELKDSDLKIETMRSSGSGGQHVNKTSSAVRITHIPTQISAHIESRSQHKNRQEALRVLRARLYQVAKEEAEAKTSQARQAQVGQGERVDKIRTYNFPQGRVTDHRTKLTRHDLEAVLAGDLRQFSEAIQTQLSEDSFS
jgi:peptide chain release factor 1